MVASSIGEEGLDIGEIDLIVCYEANKSPIRMVSSPLLVLVSALADFRSLPASTRRPNRSSP